MISRSLKIPKTKSFFLFGARGTGKSTWLQSTFSADEHLWVDLTNPDVERRYARRPALLLEEWKALTARLKTKGADQPWIIVDEVQKIPAILDVAHVGIQRHRIRFALTGSNARKLRRGAANLLAGRAQTFHMHPLTWRELGDQFDLDAFLSWGGLPEIHETLDDADRRRFLDSYNQTYMREEIQIEQLVRKIEPFRMFVDVVGQVSGEVVNIARIAREAGIDPKSGERYFEILNDTLLGRYLPAYSRSVRKRQLQHPKFYLFDVGVWRAIRRELSVPLLPHTSAYGHAFEHFIVQQIVAQNDYSEAGNRLSFLRTKDDVEVDLVVERPGRRPLFVEIKSSEHVSAEDVRGCAAITRESDADGMVLCRTPRPYDLNGLRVVPWHQGLDEIFPSNDPDVS
jgi:predicted AAA+ superfamily ATPase